MPENVFNAAEAAETCLDLLDESVAGQGELAERIFWRIIRDIALQKCPMVTENEKKESQAREVRVTGMIDAECREFEKQELRFGKYAGMTVGEVYEEDEDYLHWFAAQTDEFKSRLNRYLLGMKR